MTDQDQGKDEQSDSTLWTSQTPTVALIDEFRYSAENACWCLRFLGGASIVVGILLAVGCVVTILLSFRTHGASLLGTVGCGIGSIVAIIQGGLLMYLGRYVAAYTALFIQLTSSASRPSGTE